MTKRILLADDEADITKVLQYRLEKQGFEVITCFNGAEAMDRLNESVYDLVILDYFMPSLKGDDVCRQIVQSEKMKDTKIIVITAFSNKPEDFFKDQGAHEVVYKPIDDDALLEKIKKLLPE